ncbi:type II toxin-antitoxin system HipA family toxin [Sneathiella sp. P13V-1]|uniref:HipA domain-containing protein n=1 Tax=Sneathiella sp. P13V-1 TaxID=2697366 RepID=UPI00187B55C9|nr:HipA domain-containing protein [Sneathiella sp. P13V-1]MBE7635941.1 type II toxin-antitoxin system HipA family toxin [Sneathiella sp. P13V-1]
MTIIDTVEIFYSRFVVGRIFVDSETGLSFSYENKWKNTAGNFPISTTMPVGDDQYETILPWIANLLPEEQQLASLTEILKLASSDPLALLKEIGGDTAGALSIGEPSERDNWKFISLKEYYGAKNEETSLIAHVSDLEQRPFMAGEEGIRLSLAGGQKKTVLTVLGTNNKPKLGLPEEGDQLAIPTAGAPSTIIVKPQNERLPGIVENEAYCLALARLIGIEAVEAMISKAGDKKLLIVSRYDRSVTGNGGIKRLHQEDFAQANGIYPTQKYEKGTVPGLTLKALMQTGKRLQPADRPKLLDQVIFNILIGNTDAHAKNYSILLNDCTLAPLYDVSTVLLWKKQNINQKYAQKLAGKSRETKRLEGRHWDIIAKEIGANPRNLKVQIRKIVDAMVTKRNEAIELISCQPDASEESVKEFAEVIEQNALTIEKQL